MQMYARAGSSDVLAKLFLRERARVFRVAMRPWPTLTALEFIIRLADTTTSQPPLLLAKGSRMVGEISRSRRARASAENAARY